MLKLFRNYFGAVCGRPAPQLALRRPGRGGYADGTKANPAYERVAGQTNGHTKTVQIYYAPKVVSDPRGYYRPHPNRPAINHVSAPKAAYVRKRFAQDLKNPLSVAGHKY